jgi:restriction endonuclease S subunit
MKYKFKVGDIVRIIQSGRGYSGNIGCEVTILKLGKYSNEPGYQTTIPEKGESNAKNGGYGYMAGEKSFELIKSGETTYEIY